MKQNNIYRFLTMCMILLISTLSLNLKAQEAEIPTQTVYDTICANELSTYTFLGENYAQPGTYLIPVMAADSTDSVQIELNLFTLANRHDTINLSYCINEFPIHYNEQVIFNAPGQSTIRYTTDTNGCPIFSHFNIEAAPVYADTTVISICKIEAPYIFDEDTLYDNGIYTHTYTSSLGCDSSITIDLTINPLYEVVDTLVSTTCSFDLPYQYQDSLFYQTGIYDFEFKTAAGCDSAKIHLELTVLPTHTDTLIYNVCSNSFPFDLDSNNTFEEAGVYYIDHDDTTFCHDITVLFLNSTPAYNDTLHVDICDVDSFYVFADSTFMEPTIYTHYDTTANGCDSITTLVLNIHPSYQLIDTINISTCRIDLPYTFQDSSLTEDGVYDFNVKTSAGCDSLHLTINFSIDENPQDTVLQVVCVNDFPYMYNDTLIDTAGTYLLRIISEDGCDTLRTLTLEEAPIYVDTVGVTVCANEPYLIGDSILTVPGTYSIMLSSQYGCDSLVTINLSHYPIYHEDTLAFTTCENELPFAYGDSLFYTEGIHETYFQSMDGCDSVITIVLNINPIIYNPDTLYQEICANEVPYEAFGRSLTESGTYTFTTSSLVTGCDSVFYLHLTIHDNPVVTIQGNDYLCDGSSSNLTVMPAMNSYQWNNGFQNQMMEISVAGNYTVTVTNEYGCNGTAGIDVRRAELPNIQITGAAAICYGDSAILTVSGGNTYHWENGSPANSIVVYPTSTTTYKVTGTDNTPCSNESQFTVTVRTLPTPNISGNNVICQGGSAVFTVSNSNAYHWSNGQSTQSITVTGAGDYAVTVTDQYGCQGSTSRALTVNPKPEARISGASHFCSGESSTLKAEPASSAYLWNYNDMSEQTITITEGGNYSVTITNEYGCSNTAEKQIVIDTLPRIVITGKNVICVGESATLTVSGANTYVWDNGSSDNRIVVYPTENTTYRVTGTNSTSCSNINSFSISVRALPVASITTNRTAICQGDSAILTASVGNQSGVCSYLWSTNATSNKLTIYDANNYTVTVTDQYGCQGSATRQITVNDKPNAIISGINHFCEGGNTTLKAMPDGCTYVWSNHGLMDQSITVTSSGEYVVTVTNQYGCQSTTSKNVYTDALPQIVMGGNSAICYGDSVVLTVSGANSYRWENGSTASQITVHPTTTTTYRVTGTNNTPCSNDNSITVMVRSLPTPNITGNNEICQGESANFVAMGGNQYVWSTGAQTDRISVSEASTYYVTATDLYGCKGIASRDLVVNDRPTVHITGNNHFCEGQNTTLKAMPDGCSYQWNYNETSDQSITVSNGGSYMVTVTNNKGCSAVATREVTIDTVPTLVINGNSSICLGDSAVLTVSGANNYRWDNGSTAARITVHPTSTTTYRVTGTNNTPCSNESAFTVSVRSLPTVAISGGNEICQGDSTTFIATGGNQYVWSTGAQGDRIVVKDANVYTVTATDQFGCKNFTTKGLTINDRPTAHITGATHFCEGSNTTLKAMPNNCTYQWGYNESTDQSITVNNSGNYTVTVTNNKSCSSVATINTSIDTLPNIIIKGNSAICYGDSVVLTVSGANSYRWDNSSTAAQITVHPTSTTTYRVTGTNNTPCSNDNSITVMVRSLPTPNITGNNEICQGESANFVATGGSQYVWSTGAQTDRISVSEARTYYVTATDLYGCKGIASRDLVVNDRPTVHITGNNHFCEGQNTSLKAMPDGCSYQWNYNETSDQSITVSNGGSYMVTVTNNKGCSAVATREVTIDTVPTLVINGNSSICLGDSAVLTVSGANNYRWDNGSTAARITVHPTSTTTYRVTGTNNTPCSNESAFTVSVRSLPTVAISGGNEICQGDSTTFIATGGNQYVWSTGAQGDRIVVKDANVYTVTATDQYGCANTTTRALTVNPIPNVRINGSALFCQGRSTSLTAVGAASYEWQETGDITQSITVNQPGTYTVIGTSDKGCRATASRAVSITQVSNVSLSGATSYCHGQSTQLSVIGVGQYSYEWNNGQSTSSITISNSGSYSVTITDEHNCQKILSTYINENPLPTPIISGNLEICEGNTTKLIASGGQTYIWDGGATGSSLTVNATGTYNVTVTNVNGCSASTHADVTVYPKPTIQIMSSRDHVCSSTESITLRAIVTNGSSYFWSTGQETQSITVTPGSTSTYNVYVIDNHGCANNAATTVLVSPEIIPYITGNLSLCQGSTTTLSAYSNALSPTYTWSTHQTSSSITVNTTGTYKVTVTDNSGCQGEATANVTIHDLPTATISELATICQGDTATLSVLTSPDNNIMWRSENGQTTLGTQNTLRVTEAGRYIAIITNGNSCSSIFSTEVVVNQKPNISIDGSTTICQGNSTILTANSDTMCSYNWGTANNKSIEVNTAGLYTVTATNEHGCSNSASVTVQVQALPTPEITGVSTICPGASTDLTVTSGSKYIWSTGDTTSIIRVTPAENSNYTVTVTDEYGCSNSTHYSVQISELPQIAISGNTEFCDGDSTVLTVTPGYTYLWSNNSTSNTMTVRNADTYTVTATNSIGCQSTASVTTSIHELPELHFGMQHDICAGETFTYTLPVDTNISYHWSNNSTGNSITVSAAGIYTVTATNQYGCKRSASDNLIVHALPTPAITGENSICKGNSTMLSVSGGTRYHWSTGSSTNFIMVTPNNETTYSVTAYNEYNCSATAYHTVGVKVLPSIFFSGERTFCEGTSTSISVSGGSSCIWSTGSTSSNITVTTPGTYSVTVTNLQGCQRSDTIAISTRPNPTINISGNSFICEGGSTTLSVTGGSSYTWSTGATGSSILAMPEVTTDYTVTGYDGYGCSTIAHKTINVEPLPSINISGINAICYGDSTTFTATGGNSYVWSTGSHANSITVRNQGSYTVTATSSNGCSAAESIQLNIYPTPVATISGSSTLCENTTTQLTAAGGDFYHWNTGSAANSIEISQGGTYTVTVSNGYDCSSTATHIVTDLSEPIIYVNGASAICNGSATNLVAFGNASTYYWSTDTIANSIEVTPSIPTTYFVTATGANGCSKVDSIYVNVYPTYDINISGSICEGGTYTQNGFDIPTQDTPGTYTFSRQLQTIHGCDSVITLALTVKPLPVMPDSISGNPRITSHGSYLYNVSSTQYANTFEWRVSHPNWSITNGSQSVITMNISNNGTGILTAKGINECGFREVSLTIYCNVSVDEYVNSSNILVYPVPTHETLNINFENAQANVDQIQLYDNAGRLIKRVNVTDSMMQIDCGNVATGHYVLRFVDKNGKTIDTRKIVKK